MSSSICAGNAVTLTASGSTSGSYTWAANGTTISGQNGSALTVTPTATTTYTVTTSTSCGTSSQQVTIPVNDVTVSPSAPVICSGQSTTLTASYSGTSATYKWYIKGQASQLSATASLTQSPNATTTYQVVATTANCGTITKEVTVTVGTQTVSVSPSAAVICSGSPIALTATSTNPSATYAWSPSAGLSATTGTTVTASPTSSTTYTVTATTACGSTTRQINVVVAAPVLTVNPGSAATCSGGSVTLTADANNSQATYQWYNTNNLGTILSTSASLSVTPSSGTTYRVVSTTPCSTTSSSKDVPVAVNMPPSVTASASPSTIASGSSSILTANGASTYTWSPSEGLSATSGSTVTASPTTTTTYTVVGTSATGCINTGQLTVTVNRPLPVTLSRFDAAWTPGGPLLSWATASETDNDYFAIERSLDGVTFTTIGRQAGAGTASTAHAYQYTDVEGAALTTTTLYYRLRQVDSDGKATYSPVRTVTVDRTKLALFPNPAAAKTTLTGAARGASVRVLDALGRVVLTTTTDAAGTAQLALPTGLPSGVYIVRAGQQATRLTVE